MGCGTGNVQKDGITSCATLSGKEISYAGQGDLQRCPNNHVLIWNKCSDPAICSKCHKNANAVYACDKDGFALCPKCAARDYGIVECPNGHKLVWTKSEELVQCDICHKESTTCFACSDCDYRVCTSSCRPLESDSGQCPCGRELRWQKLAQAGRCDRCGNVTLEGNMCPVDGFLECGCVRIPRKGVQECPNGHGLEWHKLSSSKKCAICGLRADQVYQCLPCNYLRCSLCQEKRRGHEKKTRNVMVASTRGPVRQAAAAGETHNFLKKSKGAGHASTAALPQAKGKEQTKAKRGNLRLQGSEKKSGLKLNSSQRAQLNSSLQLAEIGQLVDNLIEKNASMQMKLADVINRSESADRRKHLSHRMSVPRSKLASHLHPLHKSKLSTGPSAAGMGTPNSNFPTAAYLEFSDRLAVY